MIVLGIDPGLNCTGYGVIDADDCGNKLIEAGVINTKAKHSLERRLSELYSGLVEVVTEFHPDSMSVEELYSHYKHPRTAIIMGHARGVLFLAAGNAEVPVFSYSATRIKKSLTGTGHASKDQVSHMICRTLDCSAENLVADATDALAAALCHINVISHCGDL